MKNKGLFLVLVLSMVLITCKKEEMPEPLPPPPPPPPRETIVEGRLINHITQLSLEDELVVLVESYLNVIFFLDTTDVNGEFIFHHTESKYSNQDLTLLCCGPYYPPLNPYYDSEKTIINGELNNALPAMDWFSGLKLKKGEHHSLLIEFTPFE